jgi:hypothetical protein
MKRGHVRLPSESLINLDLVMIVEKTSEALARVTFASGAFAVLKGDDATALLRWAADAPRLVGGTKPLAGPPVIPWPEHVITPQTRATET